MNEQPPAMKLAMNIRRLVHPWLKLLLLGLTAGHLAWGQVVIYQDFNGVNLDIPDNDAVGDSDEQTLTGLPNRITSLRVWIDVVANGSDPMFNGDLYVTLTLQDTPGYAVLLNRVGRREGNFAGYADSGFQVTFSDEAPSDVHLYRFELFGDHFQTLSGTDDPGSLTGLWQPYGRRVDPLQLLSTTPRDAMLSSFVGLDPNGLWTLHLADLAKGGLAQLAGWGLEITAVPEPEETLVVTALLLAAGAMGWRRRRR